MSLRKQLATGVEISVKKILQKYGVEEQVPRIQVEPTVRREHGDFATNVAMQLASALRRPPLLIAEEIVSGLSPEFVKKIEVAKPGFINFWIDWGVWWSHFAAPASFEPKAEKVVVEHTSINPNKAAHIGHLRNACLGDSLARLLRRTGYQVEVHNYIDDLGNQVADTVVGMLDLSFSGEYKRFSDYCWDLYARVNQAYRTGEIAQERRAEVLHLLEEGGNRVAWLGNLIAERNVREHLEDMREFGIRYDLLVWESDIVREGFWEAAFRRLKASPFFVLETEGELKGCWVLKQEESGGTESTGHHVDKVLVRSNGVLTYTAKDIAYHMWKFGILGKDFSYRRFSDGLWTTAPTGETKGFGLADRVLNVIDVRQEYPQQMVKRALEVLGYEKESERLHHIRYGVVSLSPRTAKRLGMDTSDGKSAYAMSGRQGIGIKVQDLLDQMEKVVEEVRPRKEGLSSREIAAAAIRYGLLKYHMGTEIVFDLEEAADFGGNSGVYLMYQHARAVKLLRDGGMSREKLIPEPEWFADLLDEEEQLLRHLAEWPEVLGEAERELSVTLIASYAWNLAGLFAKFYAAAPILRADGKKKMFRLWLVFTARDIMADAFEIIGIPAPELM
jgi:arginyl-tRNA synthetase